MEDTTILYIITGIIAVVLLILIILVSYLYYWVNKISSSVKLVVGQRRRSILDEYRISRARIQPDAPYKRFNLPQKSEDGVNSDVFFGGQSPKVENRSRDPLDSVGSNRNPLGQNQNPQLVEELKYSRNFRGTNNRNENTGYSNYQIPGNQPTPDYYANDRNRFAYQITPPFIDKN